MEKPQGLWRDTINNFIYNIRGSICFEMVYKLIVWFIFVPINYGILNSFFESRGITTITNKQVIKFALSYDGLFYMVLMLMTSFIAVFIEVIILIYISRQSYNKKKPVFLEGFTVVIRSFKKLFSIHSMRVIFVLITIGPLAGVGLLNSLIETFSIPEYLKYELAKFQEGRLIFIVTVIIMILIFCRWILALPAMVIEKGNLSQSFKNSGLIYKKHSLKIYGYIIVWVLVAYGMKIFLLGGFVGSGLFFVTLMQWNNFAQGVVSNGCLIIFFIGYVTISLVALPLFSSFLVELYYKYRFYKVEENIFYSGKGISQINGAYASKICTKKWITIILILFTIVTGTRGVAIVFDKVVEKDIEITAHRGSPLKAPENSISAITEAILEGANYVEIDVMTTKDDYVVLFHDNTLNRFNGSKDAIKSLTLEEVRQIDIGSNFGGGYEGEPIPTLEEVLNLSREQIKLNIELKTRKKKDNLAELVANMVTEYGLEDQVIISSQSYECLKKVKEINPLIDVGLIVTFGIGDFSKMDVDFISIEYKMAQKELIYAMHALNKEVHVWTINDVKKAEQLIKLGVDNIITDDVRMVEKTQDWLRENHKVDYVTRFLDGITSLIKYIKI